MCKEALYRVPSFNETLKELMHLLCPDVVPGNCTTDEKAEQLMAKLDKIFRYVMEIRSKFLPAAQRHSCKQLTAGDNFSAEEHAALLQAWRLDQKSQEAAKTITTKTELIAALIKYNPARICKSNIVTALTEVFKP